jgi:hypothetical protein
MRYCRWTKSVPIRRETRLVVKARLTNHRLRARPVAYGHSAVLLGPDGATETAPAPKFRIRLADVERASAILSFSLTGSLGSTRGGRAIPTAAVHEPGDGLIGCEVSVTNALADRPIKIMRLKNLRLLDDQSFWCEPAGIKPSSVQQPATRAGGIAFNALFVHRILKCFSGGELDGFRGGDL